MDHRWWLRIIAPEKNPETGGFVKLKRRKLQQKKHPNTVLEEKQPATPKTSKTK